MATVFSRIIAGDLPGTFVWRDDACVAFLSINPLARGHTLVVPKAEVDQWTDLPVDTVVHLTTVSHVIGQAQKRAFPCKRVGLIVAGFEVPHVHLHVVPIRSMAQLNFANAAASVSAAELEEAADHLRGALLDLGRAEVAS
jgi:diadenosine tetraphosphate (Ap4A) HIT family hydrolase